MSLRRLVVLLLTVAACAQNRVEVRATFGQAAFLDESLLNHTLAGGSARFYLTRRLSVEPEFLYLRASRRDQDWMFVPSVALDLRRPGGRVTPYVIGGLGPLWTRQLTGAGYYTSVTATWNGGVGAKIFLTDRLFLAPEARFGIEPLFRVSASIGWVLRR